ncbi:MAG: hypothetical protein OXU69_02385 [Gemmatimonadota bacterium]|nr:hypothetical protein [Gemmatimonadota bacterium]MDE2983528.1 hypothetical protein [Gemmatimonadota bacterium]
MTSMRMTALGMACFLALLLTGWSAPGDPGSRPPWGYEGHQMAARAAAATLPGEVPAFFRAASSQLVYLNPEPDRWRVRARREMDQAFQYDHYIDLENVPEGALDAPDRFSYLRLLYEAGLERPERDAGFLPYRIMELYQRTVNGWRMWSAETDPERRQWIEERIINDAGILGHYVTDASQPHHTTIHFNGWDEDTPNPEGYTRDDGFHSRFERYFVEAHLTDADLARHMPVGEPASVAGGVREAVRRHILESHAEVETLYRLDRDVGFDPETPADPAAREFAAERLAAGARMLASLWWSAWVESASPPGLGGAGG